MHRWLFCSVAKTATITKDSAKQWLGDDESEREREKKVESESELCGGMIDEKSRMHILFATIAVCSFLRECSGNITVAIAISPNRLPIRAT